MVFEGLVWNTSPGACEVEPPVAGSGPWSTTVMSSQPRADSSSASAAPTTPAPMTTTRGPTIVTSIGAYGATHCALCNEPDRQEDDCQGWRGVRSHLPVGPDSITFTAPDGGVSRDVPDIGPPS